MRREWLLLPGEPERIALSARQYRALALIEFAVLVAMLVWALAGRLGAGL